MLLPYPAHKRPSVFFTFYVGYFTNFCNAFPVRCRVGRARGVATGWPQRWFPIFYYGKVGGRWCLELDSPAVAYVTFTVTVLEFANKLKVALDIFKKILDTCGTLYVVQWKVVSKVYGFYRAMHLSAYARYWDRVSSVSPSVRPSVRPSVCDVGGLWSHRLEISETNCTDN